MFLNSKLVSNCNVKKLAALAIVIVGGVTHLSAQTNISKHDIVVRTIEPGSVDHYKLSMKMLASVPNAKLIKVDEEYANTVLIESTSVKWSERTNFSNCTVMLGDQKIDMSKSMPILTVSRAIAGTYSIKVEGGSAEGNPEIAHAIQQFSAMTEALAIPAAAKPGSKWQISFSNSNLMLGGANLSGKGECVGHEKVGELDSIKVKFKLSSPPSGENKFKVEGSLNFDHKSGKLIKLEESGTGIFAGSPAHTELVLTLVDSK